MTQAKWEASSSTASFSDYYYENENWINFSADNFMSILQSWYGEYFDAEAVNFARLKAGIENNDRKAKELFKGLYKVSHKTHDFGRLKLLPSIQNIIRHYGDRIIAHGVEEMKGGMYNLLLMCVSGVVKVPCNNWGRFEPGPPNISPLCHGPYYVIGSIGNVDKELSNPRLSDIEFILVPFSENKEILIEQLNRMAGDDLILGEQKDNFISKLLSYEEFNQHLAKLYSLPAINTNSKALSKFGLLPEKTINPFLGQNTGSVANSL